MGSEATTTKWSEFIPELYFDLIARVIPGGMLIAIYVFPSKLEDLEKISSFTAGIVYLFFAYFIGYVADVAGRLTIMPFFERYYAYRSKRYRTCGAF